MSDHGSILSRRATPIYMSGPGSLALRYKLAPEVKCDPRHAIIITNPEEYGLPGGVHYAIAKEDYYFIYTIKGTDFEERYKNTFQHGGISMQEMILPIVKLEKR